MDQNVTQKNNDEEQQQHRLKTKKISHDTSERGKLERQTDRQTDRHTDGQIDKQTETEMGGWLVV